MVMSPCKQNKFKQELQQPTNKGIPSLHVNKVMLHIEILNFHVHICYLSCKRQNYVTEGIQALCVVEDKRTTLLPQAFGSNKKLSFGKGSNKHLFKKLADYCSVFF